MRRSFTKKHYTFKNICRWDDYQKARMTRFKMTFFHAYVYHNEIISFNEKIDRSWRWWSSVWLNGLHGTSAKAFDSIMWLDIWKLTVLIKNSQKIQSVYTSLTRADHWLWFLKRIVLDFQQGHELVPNQTSAPLALSTTKHLRPYPTNTNTIF